MKKVEKKAVVVGKEYRIIGKLENDEDVIQSFEEELENTENGYICDVVSNVADSYVPIYSSELWENAPAIRVHIEESIEDFGYPPNEFSLEKAFAWGHYHYFRELLDDNLTIAIYNLLAKRLNVSLANVSDTVIQAVESDLEPIENALEEAVYTVLDEDKISEEILMDALKPIIADILTDIC